MSSEDRDKHVTVANVFKVAAEEAKDNKAFLLTCIGVITLWLGQIIILVLLLNFKVPSALVTANVISFIITLPLGALSIYNNYCVVHGKCVVLSWALAVMVLVGGVGSFATGIMGARATGAFFTALSKAPVKKKEDRK